MKTKRTMRIGCGLAAVALVCSTSAGCKTSTWKMPGSSFLSWNREPDPATLAGNSDLPQWPESPAEKYDPTAIASVGAQEPSNEQLATRAAGSGASAYGYSPQVVATPKQGLAATANGYQTGPYQVGDSKGTAATQVSATRPAGGGLPNPYGGTYSGMHAGATMPNVQMPNGQMPGGQMPNVQMPNVTLPGSVNTALNTQPNSAVPAMPSYPSLPGASAANSPTQTTPGISGVTLPTSGSPSNALPDIPTYQATTSPTSTAGSATGLPAYPALPGSGGAPSNAGAKPNSSPTTGSSNGAVYAPGTTGRSTTYDFSGGNPSGQTTLPPNTASGNLPLLR